MLLHFFSDPVQILINNLKIIIILGEAALKINLPVNISH